MTNRIPAMLLPVLSGALLASGAANASDSPEAGSIGPDQFAFSIENMDQSVDPAEDFLRYAAGGWMDRVERPEDQATLSYLEVMTEAVDERLAALIANAGTNLPEAEPGSPAQQVGQLYNALLDVETIDEAGMEPLQGELDRLYALQNKGELAGYLGHFTRITRSWPLFNLEVFEDLADASRNTVYISSGDRVLPINAIFESEEGSPLRQIYTDYVADMLMVADYEEARARDIAQTSLAIDEILHGGEMDPVLQVDTRNLNNPRTAEQLQAELPNFDVGEFFEEAGLARPENVILMEPDYTSAVSEVLDRFTLQQLQDYLALRMIQSFSRVLSTEFEAPRLEVSRALFGAAPERTREEQAVELIKGAMGQPLGRLYVDAHFSREEEETGLDMIRRIQAAFRSRIEGNEWLSDATRTAALEKVDALFYRIGYPDTWKDYSTVEITDDLVQSVINIRQFEMDFMARRQTNPDEYWAFSEPNTLPTTINAAYNPSINGFEVAAAIAQSPAFPAEMDAPVYFCRLGGVIAHEITHGFDSSGRNFDSSGTMRNWWTAADTEYFDTQAARLVALGDRYEALPGHFMSGGLTVGENLADIGGISVAHDALMQYLAEHPEENVEIDGLTPSQRCFISWTQLWVEKRSERSMMNQLEDNHAPGNYRALAPLQQVPAFYEAFGVEEGDAMWVAPEDRIDIW